jgi:hypothetical protein
MAIEEHGDGKQLIRFRAWPKCCPVAMTITLLFAGLTSWAAVDQAWLAFGLLGTITVTLIVRLVSECAFATSSLLHALEQD